MSKELMWLTLTVILTGVLWIPYILDRCRVRGLMGSMANPSRNDKPQSAWAQRLYFAHTNAVENLMIFAPLVLILNAARPFDPKHRARLRGLFLGAAGARHRLYARCAGPAHARLHCRLPGAGRAGARGFRETLALSRSRRGAFHDRAQIEPARQVPKAEPASPSSREAQNASATAAGACLTRSAACNASTRSRVSTRACDSSLRSRRGKALEQADRRKPRTRCRRVVELAAQYLAPRSACARWHAARRGT